MTADGIPKITDFGLARPLQGDSDLTRSGDLVGTPAYMAPEQGADPTRSISPACDTYALGVILYELLTGRPPFQAAGAVETVAQVLHQEPVSPRRLRPTVPRDLETICLKCLEKEPGRRYATALELAEDLRRFRAGETIRAAPGRPGRGPRGASAAASRTGRCWSCSWSSCSRPRAWPRWS